MLIFLILKLVIYKQSKYIIMAYLSLKRDDTNDGFSFANKEKEINLSYKNDETLIVTVNCDQPFKTNGKDRYEYAVLINKTCAFINYKFKAKFSVINPKFHRNITWDDTGGIKKIDFECVIKELVTK